MSNQTYKFKDGAVQISDDVIIKIASNAALEIEGVYLGKNDPKKVYAKMVKLEHLDKKLEINASIFVKYGFKVLETAKKVQEKIKTEIETITGISVLMVNVNIAGVLTEEK